jgi:hypothetical protein
MCSQATSGLGRAAAAALAGEGYHVVLGESRESCVARARTPSSNWRALIVCIVHIAQLAMSASLVVSWLVSVKYRVHRRLCSHSSANPEDCRVIFNFFNAMAFDESAYIDDIFHVNICQLHLEFNNTFPMLFSILLNQFILVEGVVFSY